MIWESGPWKRDVGRRADYLHSRARQRRWPEAALAAVEQTIFIAAYDVRKLMEAKKLSTEVEGTSVHATTYPARGQPVDLINWHRLDHLYDMEAPTKEHVDLAFFCNQLIHSFVFVVDVEPGRLHGVFVASDWQKQKRLLWFGLKDMLRVFRRVAADKLLSARYERDAKTDEMKSVHRSSKIEPAGARKAGQRLA